MWKIISKYANYITWNNAVSAPYKESDIHLFRRRMMSLQLPRNEQIGVKREQLLVCMWRKMEYQKKRPRKVCTYWDHLISADFLKVCTQKGHLLYLDKNKYQWYDTSLCYNNRSYSCFKAEQTTKVFVIMIRTRPSFHSLSLWIYMYMYIYLNGHKSYETSCHAHSQIMLKRL